MSLKILDVIFINVHYKMMIEVTRLNDKIYWLNPHQIESMELKPDLTITMLSGKTIVVKEKPDEIIKRIIEYRKQLLSAAQEF